MNATTLISLFVSLTLLPFCCGWSSSRKIQPPRRTKSLEDHLQKGLSRVHEDVSVVVLSEHECGIQLSQDAAKPTTEQEDALLLCYIDRSEFITSQCGLETNVGRAVQTYFHLHNDVREEHGDVLPAMYIAIFLSLTRQTNNWEGGLFDAYLKTLPSLQDLQHLPVFWNRDALNELQNSRIKPAIHQRRIDWEQEYNIVIDAIQEASSELTSFVDLETWCWARSILTSRAFMDDIKNEMCLVPYVDMMNHHSDQAASSQDDDVIKCSWKIDPSGFRLILPDNHRNVNDSAGTTKRIEISYGTHSNSNFLMNYGFSIANDVHQMVNDKAILSLNLESSSSSSSAATLWEADGLGDCRDICRNVTVAIGDLGPMQSLLSLCRVACCQGPELNHMKDAFVMVGEKTTQTEDGLVPQLGATLCRSPFSVFNEIRAVEMLQSVVVDGLCRYETTLAEDDDLLNKRMNSRWQWFGKKRNINRKHNALVVRRGEKQVLQHFYNLATLALCFLRVANVDFAAYKDVLEATLENNEPMLDVGASTY